MSAQAAIRGSEVITGILFTCAVAMIIRSHGSACGTATSGASAAISDVTGSSWIA